MVMGQPLANVPDNGPTIEADRNIVATRAASTRNKILKILSRTDWCFDSFFVQPSVNEFWLLIQPRLYAELACPTNVTDCGCFLRFKSCERWYSFRVTSFL